MWAAGVCMGCAVTGPGRGRALPAFGAHVGAVACRVMYTLRRAGLRWYCRGCSAPVFLPAHLILPADGGRGARA